jgi:hypothetical protein
VDDLKGKHHKGLLIIVTIHANIQRVRAIIENDTWCTYYETQADITLSRGTIEAIIQVHLKMKKLGT